MNEAHQRLLVIAPAIREAKKKCASNTRKDEQSSSSEKDMKAIRKGMSFIHLSIKN